MLTSDYTVIPSLILTFEKANKEKEKDFVKACACFLEAQSVKNLE